MERKPISKKRRFELFKRDLFKCQYCGSTPPNVVLEIDHIIPVCKGGNNSDDNIITSCFDCNRGKGGKEMTAVIESTAEKLFILKEKQQQYKLFKKLIEDTENSVMELINKIDEIYSSYHPDYSLMNKFKNGSIRNFIKELGYQQVADAMHNACCKIKSEDQCINYFCGICWNIIKGKGKEY